VASIAGLEVLPPQSDATLAFTVTIIGAGPLGRWLAQEAALAGFSVFLEDVMPHNLRHAQEALRAALGPEALKTVVFSSTIEEAVRSADLAIDCVPDELESKLEILWLLDRMVRRGQCSPRRRRGCRSRIWRIVLTARIKSLL